MTAALTHEEEFEQLAGGYDPVDETGFCRRCNDYPCQCWKDSDVGEFSG